MAMRRSRGDRCVTSCPPIRIWPEVGVSRPAIIRRRVVFPEPEGPRKTRNSPSWVSRLTSLTAPSSPFLKTLVSPLVSTTAILSRSALARFAPLEDSFDLSFRSFRGIFRAHLTFSHLREHCRDHPGVEYFVDSR